MLGSLTEKTGPRPTKCPPPSPPKDGHTSGPRDTWDPKQGSSGPHLACTQIWSPGVSPRTAPNTGKIHFFGVFGPFRAPGGREIPQDPQNPSKSSIAAAGGRTIESAKYKLRNANAVPMGQMFTEDPGGAELRPKRRPAGNIWFNPGLNPGRHPPRAAPSQGEKRVNRGLPKKTGGYHPTPSEQESCAARTRF